MAAATSDDLLSVLDQCPLNGRYWAPFDLLSAVGVVDFFDFFSVGFRVAVVGPQWHLTWSDGSHSAGRRHRSDRRRAGRRGAW